MTVSTTSIAAYRQHRKEGKLNTQADLILKCMVPGIDYSRRELVELTGLELSSICGRVNELLGSKLIHEKPSRKCTVTGKRVRPVYRRVF